MQMGPNVDFFGFFSEGTASVKQLNNFTIFLPLKGKSILLLFTTDIVVVSLNFLPGLPRLQIYVTRHHPAKFCSRTPDVEV